MAISIDNKIALTLPSVNPLVLELLQRRAIAHALENSWLEQQSAIASGTAVVPSQPGADGTVLVESTIRCDHHL